MLLLLFYALISICFSFLCSIWEAVLLSITPSYAEIAKREGTVKGKIINDFKKNIDKPLAAILTLNTIAHTIGAILVGVQANKIWPDADVVIIPGLLTLSMEAIVAVVMTIAILILSEIIPKTIGANNWKGLAGFTVKGIRIIIWILYPLVMLSQWITKSMKKDKSKSVLSRSDIQAMAAIGAASGVIREDESRIFKNLMAFHTIKLRDIMTPRTVVFGVNKDETVRSFFDGNPVIRYSRIPVYEDSLDQIVGYVLKDQVYEHIIAEDRDIVIGTLIREMSIAPGAMTLPTALEKMIKSKEHIVLVVDEFGGTEGIVTLEDIIETLLGLEILDEVDITPDLQKLARDRWEKVRSQQTSDKG